MFSGMAWHDLYFILGLAAVNNVNTGILLPWQWLCRITLNRIYALCQLVFKTVLFFSFIHITENLDPYEVEDFVTEILNNEFDTIADDGSLSFVSV